MLKQKHLGTFFIIGIPGTKLDKDTISIIRKYEIGGTILFSKNIESPKQVADLCKSIQKECLDAHGRAAFIAVDQEGGRVSRLKPPFYQSSGNYHISHSEDPLREARNYARRTAYEMRLVGINMNMSPVLDMCDPCPDFLKERIFGNDPEKVSLLGETVIREFIENGIIPVSKHFPGLGASKIDPHKELPIVKLSLKELKKHIYPFKRAISSGVPCIMTSHAIYESIDPFFPVTLSQKAVELLRKDLGFNGIIITDDMEMGAIKNRYDIAEASLSALRAGTDMVLICREQDYFLKAVETLKTNAEKDPSLLKTLKSSYIRINQLKDSFGLAKWHISDVKIDEYFSGGRNWQ